MSLVWGIWWRYRRRWATRHSSGRRTAAKEAVVNRRESSPSTSELSTGKMNPRAPGWNKRLRIGAATPSKTLCPNRVTEFEKEVRCFTKDLTENVITPVLGTIFDSVAEAYDFYNLYSWETGFGIRYGKSRLNVKRTKCK